MSRLRAAVLLPTWFCVLLIGIVAVPDARAAMVWPSSDTNLCLVRWRSMVTTSIFNDAGGVCAVSAFPQSEFEALLPAGAYWLGDDIDHTLDFTLVGGREYQFYIGQSGVPVFTEATRSSLALMSEGSATVRFWSGFTLVFASGLVGLSGRWMLRSISGGGCNE